MAKEVFYRNGENGDRKIRFSINGLPEDMEDFVREV